jgi:AbiV family abortive infection protein
MSNVSRQMNALSLPEIEALRAFALQNSAELLAEAELLFQHKRFARTYTLAHLSSEELAKLPILAACGANLANGKTISWAKLEEKLRSHTTKLKGLLFVDLLGKSIDPTAKTIQVHKQSMSRVELFNTLKNASLYAGVYQGELYKPNGIFTEKIASEALTTSRNRFDLFFAVEQVTQGRISELAKRDSYMTLLKTLGVGDDG